MHDDNLTPLERTFARRLVDYTDIDIAAPVEDSLSTARRVMATPRRVGLAAAWASLRPSVRAAIMVAILGAALVSAALIGAELSERSLTALPSASGPLPTTPSMPDWAAEVAWIADAHGIPGAADPLRLRLSAEAGASLVVAWGTAETEAVASTVSSGPQGELSLVTPQAGGACDVGSAGRYQVVEDETLLRLVAIRDDCPTRQMFLARAWVRALDGTSHGGRGVIDRFQPGNWVFVSLPPGRYLASVGADAASLTDQGTDRTLIVVRNPIGLADPCSTNGGTKLDVPSTTADFSAYLATLPGFTLQSTPITIDRRPGLRLTIPTTPTAGCASGRVAEWTPRNAATNTFWFITQGDTDRLYLTDVDRQCAVGESTATVCRDLFLIQWLGEGITDVEEQAIIDSVAFQESLPPSPS